MEVRSNVPNQVRLLRSNTFANPLAFVDELIQNAQRAGAENLDITVEDDRICFRDNGVGLGEDGPAKLFTLHESDWKSDDVQAQKPFGIGFFAVVAVANTVQVRSNQYRIHFDVAKLVEQGDTDAVTVTEESEIQPGFEVVLTDLIGNHDKETVMQRVVDVAKFVTKPVITLNGERVLQRDIMETDGSPYAQVVDNDMVCGWIRPWAHGDPFDAQRSLDLYYCGRLVRTLWEHGAYVTGLCGQLHLRDGVLDLRAPDRKEIIRNEKWTAFLKMLDDLGARLAQAIVANASGDDLDRYDELIARFLPDDQAAANARFMVHRFDDDKSNQMLTDLIRAQQSGEFTGSFREFLKRWEQEWKRRTEGETWEPVVGTRTLQAPLTLVEGKARVDGGYRFIAGSPGKTTEEINAELAKGAEEEYEEGLLRLKEMPRRPFWVMVAEAYQYEPQISRAKHYGFPLILARGKVEKRVLEKHGFPHISLLETEMKVVYQLRNRAPETRKERRIQFLLQILAEAMGAEPDLFLVGDLTVEKQLVLPEAGVDIREQLDDVVAACDGQGHVLINRRYLLQEEINYTANGLVKSDYTFLMRWLAALADEAVIALGQRSVSTTSGKLMQKALQFIYGRPEALKGAEPEQKEAAM